MVYITRFFVSYTATCPFPISLQNGGYTTQMESILDSGVPSVGRNLYRMFSQDEIHSSVVAVHTQV